MGENVAFLLNQLKEDYFEQTKYLSIPSKIDFIKGELKNCEIVEIDRIMLTHKREVIRYGGSVIFEGNRLFRVFLENELDKLEKTLMEQETQPKQIHFKDFFNNLDETKINEIQKAFKNAEYKELACMIQYLVDKGIIGRFNHQMQLSYLQIYKISF